MRFPGPKRPISTFFARSNENSEQRPSAPVLPPSRPVVDACLLPFFVLLFPQVVLPTLLTRLRKGAFLATSGASYPCLLPLLASLPLGTLLAPADGRAGAPFCAALLETLWTTICKPGGGGGGGGGDTGDRGGASGWLADVVSAHVECATFLLLKLPPPLPPSSSSSEGGVVVSQAPLEGGGGGGSGEGAAARASGNAAVDAAAYVAASASAGGGGGEGTELESVAASVSAATENVVKAVGSFVVDGEEQDAVASAAIGEGLGGRVQKAGRKSAVIGEAFSRALGQLHLGAEKGAGVMGSVGGAAAVWGALGRELKGALDQR